ncbi:hypothetical protein PHMEG_00040237 [Phytophthora megakarya]|uniref:Uncharacterized protein n=1 Tax=Phytophthora megakarya TaxID=4795 RepID=A0A225UDE7_9STRA|nr:hypothetical protein PHMEG_00040237 [Phytophthora megakarya]
MGTTTQAGCEPHVPDVWFRDRLGSRGLILLHFRETTEVECLEGGLFNVNFASNFSPSAALPAASTRCAMYDDILDGVLDLSTLGQEV